MITLVRHGKPEGNFPASIRPSEISNWIYKYNSSAIDPDHEPPPDTVTIAKQCPRVICSNLKRSISSAHALGHNDIHICDALFREMELPFFTIPFPRLPPKVWLTLFRIMWLAGFSRHGESFRQAKQRARQATALLITHASEAGEVLHVGHGFMNHYIAKYLLASGWYGPQTPGRDYWAHATYTK